MALESGQMLLHYRMVEKIGQGGMGVVWRAVDTTLDRDVAIKILPDEFAADPTRLARFEREAKILASLNHPEIASIYSLHEAEGLRFLAMELVEGDVLTRRIPEQGASLDELLAIALPLSDAVALAHQRGITHRDLKPDNVMITAAGRVKVLDFGLAKFIDPTGLKNDTQAATATAEGRILGSVAYMSPEQVEGKTVDPRSDVFSLGIVLYEMATGKRPFSGSTAISTLSSILRDTPPTVSSLRHSLPSQLDSIISRCLEKDPQRRFKNAGELRDELRSLQRHRGKAVLNRRTLRIGGMIVVPLVAALAAFIFWSSTDDREMLPTRTEVDIVPPRGPSIAVLPFVNVSGDPDQKYFSDGLTIEIITKLSRFQDLFVVPRDSTFEYTENSFDIRTTGATLGVRYVLDGSVLKVGETVRVTARLSDANNGRQLWGNSYTRDLTASDFFSLQDELTLQVVNAIAGGSGVIVRTELAQTRSKPPASLDSYECVLRCYEYLDQHSVANHLAARDCMERVVDADPDYADARAWLAYLYSEEYHHRRNERTDEYDALDRALELAEEAVRLDSASQVAHGHLALVHFFRGEYERGKIEARRTIDLNPNNAEWLGIIGLYLVQQGDFEHGMPMARKAVALTPLPPPWLRLAIFHDHYHHGRYEAALIEANGINLGGDDLRVPLFLAATYAQLGRPDETRRALDQLRALWPWPVGDLRRELIERQAYSPEVTDRLLEGLRKAGLTDLEESSMVGE